MAENKKGQGHEPLTNLIHEFNPTDNDVLCQLENVLKLCERLEALPDEIRSHNRFLLWRREKKENGKISKCPGKMVNGRFVKGFLFHPFQKAIDLYLRYHNIVDVIGFYFNDSGLTGIDIDHCFDENENLSPQAKKKRVAGLILSTDRIKG